MVARHYHRLLYAVPTKLLEYMILISTVRFSVCKHGLIAFVHEELLLITHHHSLLAMLSQHGAGVTTGLGNTKWFWSNSEDTQSRIPTVDGVSDVLY